MKITNYTLAIETQEKITIHNITQKVREMVKDTLLQEGIVMIFTKHTTTAIEINEDEKRLLSDMKFYLEKIASREEKYLHDDIHLRDCPPDEPKNGHAHMKSLLLNTSEQIPLIHGELALGKWQSILFFDFDGPRKREVIIQVMGE